MSIVRLKPAFTPDSTLPATLPWRGRPPKGIPAVNPPVISQPSTAFPVISQPLTAALPVLSPSSSRFWTENS